MHHLPRPCGANTERHRITVDGVRRMALPPAAAATATVLREIRDAWTAGRPIVPIVGAGFSAHSGYPILNSICRYLARFAYALDKGLLHPRLDAIASWNRLPAELATLMEKAKAEPIHYLEVFGWPARFGLTERVARHVLATPPSAGTPVTDHQRIE